MLEHRSWVVVGVDGSLEAVEAAQYAAQAADARGLDLLVVHAFVRPRTTGTPSARLETAVAEAAQQVVTDTLTQVRVPTGVHVHTEVERAAPGDLLLRLSRRAALVVLGQHTFDIADQLVEGSVASPLAATAECPVVVVPLGWSRAPRLTHPVAVALDGASQAEALLAFAFAEAERHQSDVVALHVVPSGQSVPAAEAESRNLEEILTAAKESHPDLKVVVDVVGGDVAQAVLDASQDVRLMVLGRPHRKRAAAGRHSLARSVLDHARCPIAVVV